MPATRLTIAANAKQSQKAPLLIPSAAAFDPSDSNSIKALVLKSAQSKLRLKKPSRIFLGGTGHELLTPGDWKTSIKDDVVLLVSTGEDYVGLKRESKQHMEANMDCSVELLASKAPVESLSVTQLNSTAHDLPGMIRAVGQPDLHPGTKFPIGAVFASSGWIHPPLIGSDIGCGMAWYRTTISRSQVDGDKGKKVAEKLRGLEGPWRSQAHREAWLQTGDTNYSAGEEWDKSLGTIGAGNHFAELQVVEESSSSESGLKENDVVLLVHSGSRGYGGSILKKHFGDTKVSFKEGSEDAKQYMEEHDRACNWAKANRDLIALRFLSCLEPGNEDWALGVNILTSSMDTHSDDLEHAKEALQLRKVVDIWHNNVEKVKWPPSPPRSASRIQSTSTSSSAMESLTIKDDALEPCAYIHRKGAAPTYSPDTGEPLNLLPLPGSRGTPTLILKPTLSEANSWGMKNALSLAHGAGRAMSRAKALSSLAQKYKGQNILEPRSTDSDGTWVICDEKDLVWEEAPEAYKDVQAVGQDLVDAGVATITGWCRARVSYKVRNETR